MTLPAPISRPSDGWLVGEPPTWRPAAPSDAEQRSARLSARLDVYARYGALVAEEAAAVLRGDLARAEALGVERAALAEHYEELRAAEPAGGVLPFRETLADALVEADHQAAVDLTLRRELTRVAEGLRLLPAPPGELDEMDGAAATAELAEPTVDGVVSSLAGRLIDARAQGVGGALSGYFPGIAGGVGGAEVATLYAEDSGDGAAGAAEGTRLDVRF
jgi:hypothetical protein